MEIFTIMMEAPDLTISYYGKNIKNQEEFVEIMDQFIKDNLNEKEVTFKILDDSQAVIMYLFEVRGMGQYTAYMVPHIEEKFDHCFEKNHWV